MRFIPFLFAGFFGLSAPTFAQDWVTRDVCDVPNTRVENPLLTADWLAQQETSIKNGIGRYWRVTTPEGAVSHLWGTMHSSHRAVVDLPREVRSAIIDADVVALEFDPTFENRAEVTQFRSGTGMWLDTQIPRPPEFLPDDVDSWIRARLVALGYGEEWYGFLTLGGLATLLLADPCDDFVAGILPYQDNRILQMAYEAGVEYTGLEQQGQTLETLNDGRYRAEAVAIIKVYGAYLNPDIFEKPDGSGIGLYRLGHIAGLMGWNQHTIEQVYGPSEGQKQLARAHGYLLDERNQNFMSKATKLIDKGNAFLAVGAFHLPGDLGLVSLLRDAGYKVERVRVDGEISTK